VTVAIREYRRDVPVSTVRKVYFMLMVADMDRAVEFYSDAFGAMIVLHYPYWSELIVAGATVALHPGRTGGDVDTGLGFEVDDLDAALEKAVQLGARIADPARERPGEGIRIAQVADTEGNVISVAERTP
jgi:predicted enzyme related to lactoylglutathione lyase